MWQVWVKPSWFPWYFPATVKLLGVVFFNLFFYCQKIALEFKCEVGISEVHGDASSSYWAFGESHHLNSELNQGLEAPNYLKSFLGQGDHFMLLLT